MNYIDKVAICSKSFSKNKLLRSEILKKYKHVKFNEEQKNLDGDELADFLSGFDKAIIGLEKITESLLASLPRLKVISKYGVGLDSIDIKAAQLLGIKIGWKGGVNRLSVAELVISSAISLLRKVPQSSAEVSGGIWRQHVGRLLTGRVFGIIGCGHVGRELIRLLEPFNCRVLVNDIVDYSSYYREVSVYPCDLDYLLKESEIISLHIPLTDATNMLINSERLGLLKKGAILINTSRGSIVDEVELKRLLQDNYISASFDVFSIEPPLDIELLKLPNLLATPHIGGSSEEAILAMGMAAIDGLDD